MIASLAGAHVRACRHVVESAEVVLLDVFRRCSDF